MIKTLSSFNSTSVSHQLPKNIVQAFEQVGQLIFYKDGMQIHARGDSKPGLSIVKTGLVKVGNYGLDGKYYLTHILLPGESFGEFTLFGKLPRTHNAEALGDNVSIIQVSKRAFDHYAIQNPQVNEVFLHSLAVKLHLCLERFDDTQRLPLFIQLAKIIINFCQQEGKNTIKLKQSDFASLLGVTVLSVNKSLKKLVDLNLIELIYGGIVIPSRKPLLLWLGSHIELSPL